MNFLWWILRSVKVQSSGSETKHVEKYSPKQVPQSVNLEPMSVNMPLTSVVAKLMSAKAFHKNSQLFQKFSSTPKKTIFPTSVPSIRYNFNKKNNLKNFPLISTYRLINATTHFPTSPEKIRMSTETFQLSTERKIGSMTEKTWKQRGKRGKQRTTPKVIDPDFVSVCVPSVWVY